MVRASGTSNPAGVRMAATFMLLLAGLFILVGIRVLQGLNWARVTLTVLLGIALVGAVMGVSNGSGTSMNITTLALAASVLVLLWLPVSSAWFRAQRSS